MLSNDEYMGGEREKLGCAPLAEGTIGEQSLREQIVKILEGKFMNSENISRVTPKLLALIQRQQGKGKE
jgi:hypothetical protein